MATSPELDRVIGIMKAIRAKPPADIHEARVVLDQAFGEYQPASDVTVFEIDADGVPCQWITAPDVPQDRLMEEAVAMAETIARHPPLTLQGIKEAAVRGLDLGMREAIVWGLRMERLNSITEDAAEGPRAFAEKRQPQWKGR